MNKLCISDADHNVIQSLISKIAPLNAVSHLKMLDKSGTSSSLNSEEEGGGVEEGRTRRTEGEGEGEEKVEEELRRRRRRRSGRWWCW